MMARIKPQLREALRDEPEHTMGYVIKADITLSHTIDMLRSMYNPLMRLWENVQPRTIGALPIPPQELDF